MGRLRLLMVGSGVVFVAIFGLFVWLMTQHSVESAAKSVTAQTSANATATSVVLERTPGNSVPTPSRSPFTAPSYAPPARDPQAKTGGSISEAIVAEPRTLQPYLANDAATADASALLYNAGLVRRDPATQAMIPLAARSYTISSDGRTITFPLRDGLTWSDGQPITADDYVWTYGRITDPATGWPYLADYAGQIAAYSAPDPHTIVVTLAQTVADPAAIANLVEPLPKHIWQNLDWRGDPAATAPQVVSGPWTLKEWTHGDHLTFVRNSASTVWPAPLLDSVTLRVVADSAVAAQGFAAGTFDLFTPEAPTAKAPATAQTYTWQPAAADWLYLGYNFRRPSLTPPLRQAISVAIDPAALAANSRLPATPFFSDVPPGNAAFAKATTPTQKGAVAAAKKVLTDAGYTQAAAGGWLDKSGAKVPDLNMLYGGAPDSERARVAGAVRDQLAALGLTLTPQGMDVAAYRARLAATPADFDLWLGGWRAPVEASAFGETWATPALNYGGYSDATVTGLYAAAAHEFDRTRRFALMAQVQQAEAKDPPYVYLYALNGLVYASPRIGGISVTPFGITASALTDWYILSR